jgi:membrane-associated phospholipid phosphatase
MLSTIKKLKFTSWQLALFILLIASIVFIELAEDVWLKEGFSWDAPLMLALHRFSQPWLDSFFMGITQTAGEWVVVPLGITAVILWRQQKNAMAIMILVSFGGTVALNTALKALFARPRPQLFPPLTVETSFSFPSGHTMIAIAFYGLLAILLWHSRRYLWAILSGLWVSLVAISRVYLGVHYPSDVLASLAVGTIWLVLILSFFQNRITSRRES